MLTSGEARILFVCARMFFVSICRLAAGDALPPLFNEYWLATVVLVYSEIIDPVTDVRSSSSVSTSDTAGDGCTSSGMMMFQGRKEGAGLSDFDGALWCGD